MVICAKLANFSLHWLWRVDHTQHLHILLNFADKVTYPVIYLVLLHIQWYIWCCYISSDIFGAVISLHIQWYIWCCYISNDIFGVVISLHIQWYIWCCYISSDIFGVVTYPVIYLVLLHIQWYIWCRYISNDIFGAVTYPMIYLVLLYLLNWWIYCRLKSVPKSVPLFRQPVDVFGSFYSIITWVRKKTVELIQANKPELIRIHSPESDKFSNI